MNLKDLHLIATERREYAEADLLLASHKLISALMKEVKDKPTFYLPPHIEALLLKAANA